MGKRNQQKIKRSNHLLVSPPPDSPCEEDPNAEGCMQLEEPE
jgi:hypothetical protein